MREKETMKKIKFMIFLACKIMPHEICCFMGTFEGRVTLLGLCGESTTVKALTDK